MANEKRLIDANALLKKMEYTSTDVCANYGDGFCEHGYSTQLLRLMVSETPTVDAVEVVHGRWMSQHYRCWIGGQRWKTGYQCSSCRSFADVESPYCPKCGAKMDGDGNG